MNKSWADLSERQRKAITRAAKYHGGPVLKVGQPKEKRGLRQTQKLPHGKVIEVMKSGQVLHPKRLEIALPQIRQSLEILAERNLSPQRNSPLPGRAGMSSIQIPPRDPEAGERDRAAL